MKLVSSADEVRTALRRFHEDESGEAAGLTNVILILVAAIIVIGLIAFWGKLKTSLDGFITWLTAPVDNPGTMPGPGTGS